MPELPEVETVVRGVRPRTVGRRVAAVRLASALMARSFVGSFRRKLAGREILRLDRHGKWMFFRLDDGNTLVIHLGMTGRLGVERSDAPLLPHTHLRLALDEGTEELRFVDPRRFGELLLCDEQAYLGRFGPGKLGPDATRITVAQYRSALSRTQRRIKCVLLDQRSVAGIGNIYADEILFAARLHPSRRGSEVTLPEIKALHRATGTVLRQAIRHNGTSIRDYVTSAGVPGEFQERLLVYGRAQLPCRVCQTPIAVDRGIVSGRSTHWCPICQ